MDQNPKIIIVGGGLSGLTLAYLLSKENMASTILEASSRLGGRIQTIKGELETPLELGATWFSDEHQNLISLLEELDLEKYPQFTKGKSLFQINSAEPLQEFYVPETEAPSYRIKGGTEKLIEALSQRLASKNIRLNTKVASIKEVGEELVLRSDREEEFLTDKVVLCLPPQLVGSEIQFHPKLPDPISKVLPVVQTWMAGSIKFAVEYAEPFWRNQGYSGMLFSHAGIIMEMYDHTNFEANKFGFTGFLNGLTASQPREVRKAFTLRQLEELLGPEASKATTYADKVWNDAFILGDNQVIHQPHQNNGHPLLQESYMNGKLLFSGTESSAAYSGYMEGAVRSAKNIFYEILS